jgi:hypothetical protein
MIRNSRCTLRKEKVQLAVAVAHEPHQGLSGASTAHWYPSGSVRNASMPNDSLTGARSQEIPFFCKRAAKSSILTVREMRNHADALGIAFLLEGPGAAAQRHTVVARS